MKYSFSFLEKPKEINKISQKRKKREINNLKQRTIIVKKERFISFQLSLKSLFILLFVLIILLLFLLAIYFDYIEVYLTKSDNFRKSMLFSILTSMILLMFMVACGMEVNYSNFWLKIIFIIICILLVYRAYYNYGFGIYFNNIVLFERNLFYQPRYESNSFYGITFFSHNIYLWSGIYVISIVFMTRD